MKPTRLTLVVLATLVLAAACSSNNERVSVSDPWGRTSPAAASNGAFYMQLDGGDTDDVLIGADSPACQTVELHETQMSDGVMSMQRLSSGIPVPAGETVSLEPGGLHVMCLGLTAALVEGESATIQLQFESSGLVTVSAEIRGA